jgi:hypothetical protein
MEKVELNQELFVIPAFVNKIDSVRTLLDGGSSAYALISRKAASRCKLPRIQLPEPIGVAAFDKKNEGLITEVAVMDTLDIGGSCQKQKTAYAYIVPRIEGEHEMILGRPWFYYENAVIDPERDELHIQRTNTKVRNLKLVEDTFNVKEVSAQSFSRITRRNGEKTISLFKVSMSDIEKALRTKEHTDPRTKLPKEYWKWLDAFDRKLAERLPPHRKGVDHRIEVEPGKDGRDQELPWGPLYGMSREELLVLRKTLSDLLTRGFIRVSSSPAAAPILFVKKPGGGLRFCCDYRALNAMTKKDRYPLPLIKETLSQVSSAQWYTKLDIIAAFNKIRMAEGEEWKTAFRTRYGLFEWLVMPFGLANAPSSFQRFVNWVLRDYLDDFVSAYVDDVLIYTQGTKKDHEAKVKVVLQRLMDAGLQIDIDKCEFSTKTTKYLGFILEAGRGIRMDPEKVKAIQEWELPTSTKGVRGFLGFANFYRSFIQNFADTAQPLVNLTKKALQQEPFAITPDAKDAFNTLKTAFLTAPMLAQFDESCETVVECDASGWATGGALMQYVEGVLRPVAFFSRRMTPAECNYEIYDKELLAVISCLEEWTMWLKPLKHFVVRTDHKNLEYYKSPQKLTERQVRWYESLTQFNAKLVYKPGRLNVVADALSRRDQDIPKNAEDDRLRKRVIQVIKPQVVASTMKLHEDRNHSGETYQREDAVASQPVVQDDMTKLWTEGAPLDKTYQGILTAVLSKAAQLPTEFRHLKLSMNDLSARESYLLFRERFWVPDVEPLKTGLMQSIHDSLVTGHPGKEGLTRILSRKYFWPGMGNDVRRFVRNCHSCGRNTVWRSRRQGLLRPLPVPERIWNEISMDYITDLPLTATGSRHLLVITDRLGKGLVLIPCRDLESGSLAKLFIRHYYANHGLPSAITSDRGDQFVHGVWSFMCKILGIKQRLSTAYHPETDGSTERANQVVEEFVRHFCSRHQEDWDELMPIAQAAISQRDATSTGVSPFFLAHGYHPNLGESIQLPEENGPPRSPAQAAIARVRQIQECTELVQSTMAYAQQRQQEIHDKHRDPPQAYRVGDKVWLDMRNIRLRDGRKRKFVRLHEQFKILEVLGNDAYRLNTPRGISPTFHAKLLRPVASDPFPSQLQDDAQPEPVEIDGEHEYSIDNIVDVRIRKGRGRGGPLKREFLVRWTGYAEPTWEPWEVVQDTQALDIYEAETGRNFLTEPLSLPGCSTTAPKTRRRGVL